MISILSDDECTMRKAASVAMTNLESDPDSGINSLIAEETSGNTVMSEGPYWEDIVITEATTEDSILVQDKYFTANDFAVHGCLGVTPLPRLQCEQLMRTHDSYL